MDVDADESVNIPEVDLPVSSRPAAICVSSTPIGFGPVSELPSDSVVHVGSNVITMYTPFQNPQYLSFVGGASFSSQQHLLTYP